MTASIEEVWQAFDIGEDELASNRKGKLSKSQIAMLTEKDNSRGSLMRRVGTVLIIYLILMVIFPDLRPVFDTSEIALWVFPGGIFIVALVSLFIVQAQNRLSKDLSDRYVISHTAKLRLDETPIRINRETTYQYFMHIGRSVERISEEQRDLLKAWEGKEMIAYVTAHAEFFLTFEPAK